MEDRAVDQKGKSEDSFDGITGTGKTHQGEAQKCWIYYGFYNAYLFFLGFFRGEECLELHKLRKRREISQASNKSLEDLFSNIEDIASPELSGKLLELHRNLEDTKARGRLERWATKLISRYLLSVLGLILLNGLASVFLEQVKIDEGLSIFNIKQSIQGGFISDTVMTVLLTTTTINVIGLGIIVLRGHFTGESTNLKRISENSKVSVDNSEVNERSPEIEK